MTIVFTTSLPREGFSRLEGHTLVFPDGMTFTPESLMQKLRDADVLVSTFDYIFSADTLAYARHLRLIANFGAGYNNLPVEWCKEHGIVVTNTPQPVIEPTAELCFALMHAVARRTAELDRRLRMQQYGGIRFGVMQNLGATLYGKILGIIGLGRIGQAVARRAVAAGMSVIYHNRNRLPKDTETLYCARYVSLEELLGNADFVSLNLPYTPEVYHLIDAPQLALMKSTAFLINTARGAHVNEEALATALYNKQIAGAAMDVFEHEPEINARLLKLDNVVLSPHVGTGTWEGRLDMCHNIEDNILAFAAGNEAGMNRVI